MNKEKLQIDINLKKKELENLKSKTLSDIEKKNETNKITKKIEELQKKLNDLKKLESETTVSTTQKKTDQLKQQVDLETPRADQTYELIKGSVMEKKLKTLGKTDIEIKEFALNIDAVVRKFLDKELVGFSNTVKNSACVGIQFAMMETLTAEGVSGTRFFDVLGSTDTTSAFSTLEGFFKAFNGGISGMISPLNKGTKFFDLANRVQNLTYYLQLNKNTLTQIQDIPELMNPAKFKLLLNNPVWDKADNVYTTELHSVMHLGEKNGLQMSAAEKKSLQDIANNPNIPINEKTLGAIKKALGTADTFLNARGNYKDKASEMMKKIGSMMNIEIPLIGNLGELFGMSWPVDVLGKRKNKKENKVLNFILRVVGFPAGVEGLHSQYVKENIDIAMGDDVFVRSSYHHFQSKISSDVTKTHDDPNSTWKKFESNFSGLKEDKKKFLKDKLPPQYDLLKQSIVDSLKNDTKLNGNAVKQFAPELVSTLEGISVVDMSKISDKDAFAEKYLQYIIPKLSGSGEDFIASVEVNQNTFALAVFGNLIADKFFIEGINIGVVNSNAYKEAKISSSERLDQNKKLSDLNFGEAKSFAYAIFGRGPATQLLVQMSNNNPAMILRVVALGMHEGKLDFGRKNEDPNKKSKQINIGSFQLSDREGYIVPKYNHCLDDGLRLLSSKGIDFDPTKFKKLKNYTDPTGTNKVEKAQCDLVSWLGYVWTARGGDTTFGKLADGKLTDNELKPLIHKTIQGGISAIGDGVVKQINENKVSDYTAISNLDFQSTHEKEDQKESYKNSTLFVGDSLTEGFAKNLGYKVYADELRGKTTTSMLEHFDETVITADPKPQSVVIVGGTNDLYMGASAQVIFENLQSMYQKAKDVGISPIMGTILPMGEYLDKNNAVKKNSVMENISELNSLIKNRWPNEYVDFYSAFEDGDKKGYAKVGMVSEDGLHPNGVSYQKMNDMVFERWKE